MPWAFAIAARPLSWAFAIAVRPLSFCTQLEVTAEGKSEQRTAKGQD